MECLLLFLQRESAHSIVEELGHMGVVQFQDFNEEANVSKRPCAKDVARCAELERQVRVFREVRVSIPI